MRLDDVERDQFLAEAADRLGDGTQEVPTIQRSELPTPPTQLVGREGDLIRLKGLLRDTDVRLITLTGPGGVGKTRLAGEAVRQIRPDFLGGVAVVDLAPVTDPLLVQPLVATGGKTDPSRSGRRLLVVDNFEHLLSQAQVVSTVLAEEPQTCVLATSRARLRLRGEVEVTISPLQLPEASGLLSLDKCMNSPAVQLFFDRARDADPAFTVTAQTAADIASICTRLDGLPLAIELAAAKSRILAPGELLRHLDEATANGSARDLPARQHSLRTTLDWSYRLLDQDAQDLLACLSVFAGGFTLDAVEALAKSRRSPTSALASLETLVEHSLVMVLHDPDGRLKYRLLEPIRQYAAELLKRTGEVGTVQAAHATYFLSYAERADPRYHGRDQVIWLERADWETDNLRAAMQTVLAAHDGLKAARLGWALWLPWWNRGQFDEGRRCMEAALQLETPPIWRSRIHVVHASLCDAQGDTVLAAKSWAAALDLARSQSDPVGEAYGLAGAALVAMSSNPEEANRKLGEALPLAEATGEHWLQTLCTIWLGTLKVAAGDPETARPLFEHAVASARDRGDRMLTSVGLINLAQAALLRGPNAEAESYLKECVTLAAGMGTHVNMGVVLALLAITTAHRPDWKRSATLMGASERMRQIQGAHIHASYLYDPQALADTTSAARTHLGQEAFDVAFHTGESMDLTAATTYALEQWGL